MDNECVSTPIMLPVQTKTQGLVRHREPWRLSLSKAWGAFGLTEKVGALHRFA